ncbi:MAG: carbon starvation protein A [Elusimicrobia bacterium]|nr:carbon starvation protein A [Elusimicrobiota bacterium]
MNAVTMLIIALCVYALAYKFYAAFIISKVLTFDKERKTPAYELNNGSDYKPTNKWVLFGHHFAAIAGAGPLVGPVLAAQFGYLPGFLWILIGAVLAGAVHDMVVLFISVRYKGISLTEIAKIESGKLAGTSAGIAVFFIIITALAGLAMVVVNALAESAWGTFSIAATIPIALFVGLYMEKFRPGKIREASVIGLILVLSAIFLGEKIASSKYAGCFLYSRETISIGLAVYGMLASVLPVWLLLAPRDYLSSYMKVGTIGLLALGIIWVRPEINFPAFTQFINGGGPIIPGKVWPYVCITIACGAISGFHSLISSGTTPKMIESESEIKFIAYGAMLTEGFVALMALIAATALPVGDYFAINLSPEAFSKMGLSVSNLPSLSAAVGENLEGRAGGAVTLAVGMAQIFSNMPAMKHLLSYWYHFAIMFEALFILTTIDAGTRVARYITQEAAGKIFKPLGDINSTWAVLFTSASVSFLWGSMVLAGNVKTIWPMFGVANQLLSAIALAICTTYIIKRTKKIYALITFVPFIFMISTTFSAAFTNITENYLPMGNTKGYINVALTAAMIVLASIISVVSIKDWFYAIKKKEAEKNT